MRDHFLPSDIERSSMAIIQSELQSTGITIPEREAPVTLRCIHATADFDYAQNMYFSGDAISSATSALSESCPIVTDTNMALAGLSRTAMKKLKVQANCYMSEDSVSVRAHQSGCTRAVAAMDYAAEIHPHAIRVIGNAPTALLRTAEQIECGLRPALVIAVPVGFVNVTESKERIISVCRCASVPVIAAMGRKGGSTVAAAVCNALLYLAADMLDPSERGWN